MGQCDKATTFQILDHFVDLGGNFVDTANNYQDNDSELWIGEWMEARKNRDQIVIATKFGNSCMVSRILRASPLMVLLRDETGRCQTERCNSFQFWGEQQQINSSFGGCEPTQVANGLS